MPNGHNKDGFKLASGAWPIVGRHPGWPVHLGPLVVDAGIVELRPPKFRDGGAWSRIRLAGQDHLEQWEPSAPGTWEDRNSVLAWPSQWSALKSLARKGGSLPFVITVDGRFAGQITVGNIIRGSLCSAWIGYWVDQELAGGGVGTAAVAMLVDHCLDHAGLHRLEATVRPENEASLRVLDKIGFRQEGLFQKYLDVAGQWRDHYGLALTAEDVWSMTSVPAPAVGFGTYGDWFPGRLARRLIGLGHAREL